MIYIFYALIYLPDLACTKRSELRFSNFYVFLSLLCITCIFYFMALATMLLLLILIICLYILWLFKKIIKLPMNNKNLSSFFPVYTYFSFSFVLQWLCPEKTLGFMAFVMNLKEMFLPSLIITKYLYYSSWKMSYVKLKNFYSFPSLIFFIKNGYYSLWNIFLSFSKYVFYYKSKYIPYR